MLQLELLWERPTSYFAPSRMSCESIFDSRRGMDFLPQISTNFRSSILHCQISLCWKIHTTLYGLFATSLSRPNRRQRPEQGIRSNQQRSRSKVRPQAHILAGRIQDAQNNETRFIVLSDTKTALAGDTYNLDVCFLNLRLVY
jgi:hypothetical protein